jgi:PAS domain S-box-containing protein
MHRQKTSGGGRHAKIVALLQRLYGWRLWLLMSLLAVLATELIVTVMSWLFLGTVSAQYLLTGLAIDAVFVPAALLLTTYLLQELFWRQREALKESRKLLQTIVDAAPMRIFWKDQELRYLGCNQPFASDAGMAHPDDLLGKDDFQMGWAEQAELYRAGDRAVMESGTARLSYDEPQTTPDGQTIWLRTSKVPLRNIDNETIGILGIYEDITERKFAQDRLLKTQEQLIQADKFAALGSMVAGISHELNTPIGNTLTVASTLHDQVVAIQAAIAQGELRRSVLMGFLEALEEMSGIITRSTSRAAELIQSFKQVAIDRTNEGRRDFGVRALCEDIVTSLKAGMRKAPAIITIDIPGSLECDSYPGPLGQILSNLVQNAIVHAFGERTDGRIAIAATLDSTGSRPTVVLTVTDDGVGMSEHTRSHAFDPFFTTRFGQGGSGLGLSIAHKLAASTLEGSLSVESSPGRGSCFTLRMAQHVDGT